jgi:hypothetical protein
MFCQVGVWSKHETFVLHGVFLWICIELQLNNWTTASHERCALPWANSLITRFFCARRARPLRARRVQPLRSARVRPLPSTASASKARLFGGARHSRLDRADIVMKMHDIPDFHNRSYEHRFSLDLLWIVSESQEGGPAERPKNKFWSFCRNLIWFARFSVLAVSNSESISQFLTTFSMTSHVWASS